MSKIADAEANATSLDGLVNDNGLIPTLRNGPKPSYQYLADGWNAEIAATILELNKSRGFRVVGTFADGFTYELFNDVGIDASGNSWIYVGAGAPNKVVSAGTVPSVEDGYEQVTFNAASGVIDSSGSNVQDFIDTSKAQGIMPWDADITYPVSGLAKGSDGESYISLASQSGNDPISDNGTNWKVYINTTYSSVQNMISGLDINGITRSVKNGELLSTGSTTWQVTSEVTTVALSNGLYALPLGPVSINDFGALASLGDSSPAIQLALDTGYPVTGSYGSYNCQSEVSINTRGQIFDGKNKDLFILDFSAGGDINGVMLGRDAGASLAQVKNMSIKGSSSSDVDRNAGLVVRSWTRGYIDNVYVTGFAIGHTWEGNSAGHANTLNNVYYWKNRVAAAYLDGGNHGTNFVGGELAQGHYGAVIGKLNADGTLDDDFGANTGGNVTFFGTIIEGQDRTSLAICNGQLGVTFDGYFEAAAIQDNFVRIGSQFKNDGITPATAVAKGIHIRGHAGVNAGIEEFAAVKIGAVVGGSCSLMCSGNNLVVFDTTECRFSTNFTTDGTWCSSGKYSLGASNNTVSADVYPPTREGGAYQRRYLAYSAGLGGYRSVLTLPSTYEGATTISSRANGKILSLDSSGTEVGYFESSSGDRMNWVANGTVSKWSTNSQGVQQVDFGAGKTFTATLDNAVSCGYGAIRWSEIFAATGTISTSDEREKTELLDIDATESLVAKELKGCIKKFRFNDAITKKGDKARIHFGVGAQTVKSVFEKHGLKAEDYSLLCLDEWDDVYEDKLVNEQVIDDNGNIIKEAEFESVKVVEAGSRYGIRYEELICFILGSL